MSLLEGTPTPRMDLMLQESDSVCESKGGETGAKVRARDSAGA